MIMILYTTTFAFIALVAFVTIKDMLKVDHKNHSKNGVDVESSLIIQSMKREKDELLEIKELL